MTKLIKCLLVAGAIAFGGCGAVLSSGGTYQNANGDAWYTEGTGFFGMYWGSHIYYCPPPTSGPVPIEAQKQVSPGSVQFTATISTDSRRVAYRELPRPLPSTWSWI